MRGDFCEEGTDVATAAVGAAGAFTGATVDALSHNPHVGSREKLRGRVQGRHARTNGRDGGGAFGQEP